MRTIFLIITLVLAPPCFADINEDIEYARNEYNVAFDKLNTKLGECITEMKSRPFITSGDIEGFDSRTLRLAIAYLGNSHIDACTASENYQYMLRTFSYYDALTKVSLYSKQTKTLQDEVFIYISSGGLIFEKDYKKIPQQTRIQLEERLKNKNLRSYPTFESSPQYGFDNRDEE